MAQEYYLALTSIAVYGTRVLPSSHIACSLWHNSATQCSHRLQSMAQQCYLALLPSTHIACSLWHNSAT